MAACALVQLQVNSFKGNSNYEEQEGLYISPLSLSLSDADWPAEILCVLVWNFYGFLLHVLWLR